MSVLFPFDCSRITFHPFQLVSQAQVVVFRIAFEFGNVGSRMSSFLGICRIMKEKEEEEGESEGGH